MTANKYKTLAPAIDVVPMGPVTIFHVSEDELDAIERGGPDATYLNLGVAAISIAVSFLIALTTTKMESDRTYCAFFLVMLVGFVSSLTFLLLSWRSQRSVQSVIQKIRSRKPVKGVQEPGELATEPRE